MDFILTILLGFISCIYFTLKYFCGQFNIFYRQGIPGPRPIPIFGTWWNSWKENPHEIAERRYEKYGDIYCSFRGRNPVLHVQGVNLLRSILIKDSLEYFGQRNRRPVAGGSEQVNKTLSMLHGEQWSVVRNLVVTAFSTPLVKERLDFANESVMAFVEYWKQNLDTKTCGGSMDLRVETELLCSELMMNYTCGMKLGTLGNPNHPFVINARKTMERGERGCLWTLAQLYPKLVRWLCPFLETGNEYFVNLSKRILMERKSGAGVNDTNPHHMTQAPDLIDKLLGCLQGDNTKKAHVDENVAIAQTFSTILTGYDLGAVLTRVLHCLTMDSTAQSKCREEITRKLKLEGQGVVSFRVLANLPYVDQSICEALRLYPTIFATVRVCTKEKRYDDLLIPQGTTIEYPLYRIQRNAKFFSDPLRFDPERFSAEKMKDMDPLVFLPFGRGPRACPAQTFSIMVLKQCLVHILTTFEFFPIAETRDPISFTTGPSGTLTGRDMWVGYRNTKI